MWLASKIPTSSQKKSKIKPPPFNACEGRKGLEGAGFRLKLKLKITNPHLRNLTIAHL
jgi:hypothetical protein